MPSIIRRSIAVVLTMCLGTVVAAPALAGTTGTVSGTVVDTRSGAPVAGASVTAASPSGSATATTDAGGHFNFVSLVPDEYTLTVQKKGYDTTSFAGVAVFADAAQVVTLRTQKTLTTIAKVTSRSSGSLVRSGTTADVYSINAGQQARTSVLGGGGNLNSAYSAIAAVPGAYVPTNQAGYNQAVHVRGGDSSEVGYEFDGIPVNRAFDNYPSGSASSLGQLELQVYTGASPANAEAQGLAGFINQVIKTGTYPGTASADLTIGAPTFYHSLNVEAGGSTPDRRFNYYVGIGGFNQEHRYIDQYDGAAYANEFGPPLGSCPFSDSGIAAPPSCFTHGTLNAGAGSCFDQNANGGVGANVRCTGYVLGPMPFGLEASGVQDRSTVLNFHFAIPHKNGDLHDDVQLLYDNDSIQTPLYVSPNDEGAVNIAALGTPLYSDTYQYTGATGQVFADANVAQIQPYLFPFSPTNRAFGAPLPADGRDVQYNDQGIVKVQYQHNFSTDAYLRVYGYTYYSDFIATGAASSWQTYVGFDSGDYEVNSHTRGLSASYVQQLNPENLISLEGSYTTATSERMNASTVFNQFGFSGRADNFAVLVNPNDLTSGTCYSLSGGPIATPQTCGTGHSVLLGPPNALAGVPLATFASLAYSYLQPNATDANGDNLSAATLATMTCGSGPCALYTVENGFSGKINTVEPVFSGLSLTDEWRPSDRWLVNLGIRADQYTYEGDNTTGGAARAFWFNAFNNDTCYNPASLTLIDKWTIESQLAAYPQFSSAATCASLGSQYDAQLTSQAYSGLSAATIYNVPNQTFTYNIVQPRVGATYTFNPDTVVRASFGKYTEQPSAAYEQYDALNQNLPDQLAQFYSLGFNTPGHQVRPPTSYNADFSYERHFKGTDMSVKISPFVRKTHDQIENFYLNIQQSFISGLNAGNQTSDGFEFAFTKGAFDRDGFAAQVGFAYTYASLKFSILPNGSTILSPINAGIANYNAYTQACAAGGADVGKSQFGQSLCGATTSGVVAAPCYAAGAPDQTCSLPNTIANPYWKAPAQGLLDPNASYLPYSTIPGGVGSGVNAYNYPYVASLILQWKHKNLAVSPSFQYVAGNRYGAPETTPGIDPTSCTVPNGGTAIDSGRYPYGAVGGVGYDAANCGSPIVIPDSYTGQFDAIGAFRQPAQLLGHLRISYDINPRMTATVTFANLLSTCFGGQQTSFTYYYNNKVCSYGPVEGGYVNPVGNQYNPGDNVQTVLKYPYQPVFGTYNDLTSSTTNPFSVYFDVKIKL